jgi:DNA repair exonuclease SbcCD ATPase subunit
MLSRGRKNDLFLYEVTDQDLVLASSDDQHYAAGNILMFTSRKDIKLGHEIAKADDLATANEYLQNGTELLMRRLRQQEERLSQQAASISSRDTLLHELADDLESQKYSNQLLIAQMEQLREQINIVMLSREEAIDDLEQVSAETHSRELELTRAIEDKLSLEQELAAMITDLVELNAQNDDLKRRLDNSAVPLSAKDADPLYGQYALQNQANQAKDGKTAAAGADFDETLTLSSGKRIHIYHDFPTLQKSPGMSLRNFAGGVLRGLAIAVACALVLLFVSVLATANLNGLSLGAALDLIVRSLGLPWATG